MQEEGSTEDQELTFFAILLMLNILCEVVLCDIIYI